MSERGARPAFYAMAPGGWRDYWTLLHVPYTAWHLSYVAMGAATAPTFDAGRWGLTTLGFFLGMGIGAHALDELSGRPLATRIPDRVLQGLAALSLMAAAALGAAVAAEVSWWLLAFVGFGAFIAVGYNLELFGGIFHTDLWFAISWGAFPALTAHFAQTGTIGWEAALVALACLFLSVAQRTLSTPVRRLRRQVAAVEGRLTLREGKEIPVDESLLRHAPETALRALAVALPLLAAGLVVSRLL